MIRISSSVFLLFTLVNISYASQNTDWKKTYVPIQKLIATHTVSALFTGVGGHSGSCVALDINNHSNNEQKIFIEAGDKLICENESMQNIFITQDQYIVLAPNSTKKKAVYGFCCSSAKSSPQQGVHFSYSDNDSVKEQLLARYLNVHPQLDLHAVQHAVWVVCNGASIDGIYAENPNTVLDLKKKVSEITGQPIPWYTKKYDQDSSGRLLQSSSKLVAIMDFNLSQECQITVQICDAHGEVLKVPMQERMLQRGHYDYQFTWETTRLVSGIYYARIFSDGRMIQERQINL